MKLKDKVAIVTGGAQGLGKGIAQCLANEGASIAILDINGENAEKMAQELAVQGRKSLAVQADLTISEQVERAVKEVLNFFGKIDILINNAGGYPTQIFDLESGTRSIDRTEEEWDTCYDLNLKTQVLMCRAVIPHMVDQKSGKIVNISSGSAGMPSSDLICYATAKAASVHYTRILSRELAKDNINVNCVCPGVIYTPLWEKGAAVFTKVIPEAKGASPRDFFLQALVSNVPLGRQQTPEDIGYAVTFFVTEEAKNITGQTLYVDGGMAFV